MFKALSFLNKRAYQKELKSQLKLFTPFLLGQLCSTGMGVADTIMAGMAGTVDLSGVAIGCSFLWPAFLFIVGLAYAVTPTTSHLLPTKKFSLIQKSLFNALVITFVISCVVAIILSQMHLVFNFLDTDAQMIEVATDYLYVVSLGLPFTAIYNIFRSYAEGLGYAKPTMYFGILMLILDIPLNYIFIFGHLGMPALGGVGCGVATALIFVVCSILMTLLVTFGKFFKQYQVTDHVHVIDKTLIKQFLKLGIPFGVSRTIEVACFSLAAVIISPFGPTVVAAHSITLNISGMIFMIPMCLGMTMTIRTAYAMGTKNWAKAYLSVKTGLSLDLVLYAIYASLVFIFRENLARIYTQDEVVLAMTTTLIIFNCIYMLPDSLQALFLGVLQGMKDSKTIFYIIMISYWVVGMPTCFLLAWGYITGTNLEAYGIWLGFICALLTASILFVSRTLYLFKTKKMPKLLAQSFQG